MFPGTHLGNNTSPEKKGLVRVGGVGDVFCTSV